MWKINNLNYSKIMELRKVRLRKVSDDFFKGKHPNDVNAGYVKIGLIKEGPVVGKQFRIDSFHTSLVTEIITENIFKTLFSTYILEYLDKERQIVLNRIMTPDGTIIVSRHTHDYVEHKDKNGYTYMVDGGNDYLRRTVIDDAPYTEMSLYEDSPFDEIRENVCRGGRGINGDQPLIYVSLSRMSNEWLVNCVIYNTNIGFGNSISSRLYLREIQYRKDNNITIDE